MNAGTKVTFDSVEEKFEFKMRHLRQPFFERALLI